MNIIEVERQMRKLWKDTFHDNEEYVELIFKNYFNKNYIAYKEINGRIVSALMGIPYIFKMNTGEMKGLYLCGLSTVPEYRKKGYMRELIEEINIFAKNEKFNFTFLIPADDSLVNYYSNLDYIPAMFRIEDRYTELHDFRNDYISSLSDKDDKIKQLKIDFFDKIICKKLIDGDETTIAEISTFIHNKETKSKRFLQLQHTEKDIKNIIQDNIISKGEIIYALSVNNIIIGVSFIQKNDNHLTVVRSYSESTGVDYSMLKFINQNFPEYAINVFRFPEETDRKALITKIYGASNPDGEMLGGQYGMAERVYKVRDHAKLYGMVRILDIYEILKFIAEDSTNLKFSILIRSKNDIGNCQFYKIDKGTVVMEEISSEKKNVYENKPGILNLSLDELLHIIFRKNNDPLIMEAFGIPRMVINMALLLD